MERKIILENARHDWLDISVELVEDLSSGNEYYSVYLHGIDGTERPVADVETEEEALELMGLIQLTAQSYKPEPDTSDYFGNKPYPGEGTDL